jgi:DNA-binding Lrp family transcriptional regulator
MADTALSPLEQALLACIQSDFPLVSAPYTALATQVSSTAAAVHAAVLELRQRGVVRRIGGSFAAGPLGYVSTLVGARVDAGALEAAAACASAFPEVTHNYEREGDYNLWFTVIAATRQRLEHILGAVGAVPGVQALHDLPARRLFKIRVDFQFAEGQSWSAAAVAGSAGSPAPALPLDEADRRSICRACGDLDASRTPFRTMAAEVGLPEAELLGRLAGYRHAGAMRRFGAILRHRAAGFTANGMSVWDAPEEDVQRLGEALAARPEVSHCYERPRLSNWPYNVFGMIHAKSRAACLEMARAVSRETGVEAMRVLFSGREFKKTSMVYFAEGVHGQR